jgi:4,5-dihydroxyphthalate decarboxylase
MVCHRSPINRTRGTPVVNLRTVTRTQGNNAALKTGEVTPRGFEFDFEEVPVLVHAFRRMVRGLEFDVCEMAFTTYLCAKEHGKPITALPIFLVRGFHHGAIVHNRRLGIAGPKDLAGHRVGVNRGYTVTTGVWVRGILADQYGLDPNSVTWVLSGDEHVAEYQAPSNVVSMPPDGDLGKMVTAGELAAAIGVQVDHPDVAPLIPDAEDAGYQALRQHGVYPINHLVVVKDEMLAKHPDLAPAVFEAFATAKNRYVDRLLVGAIAEPTKVDRMHQRVAQITGGDPLPYGIEPNRGMIEALIRHALDQKILRRVPAIDDLFAAGTHDLVA